VTQYIFKSSLGAHSTLIVMDSGVVTSYESQLSFLNSTLSNSNTRRKYVLYHGKIQYSYSLLAPLYPSARSFLNLQSIYGRKYWEPLFSFEFFSLISLLGQYNVIVGFEHHDHLLKRTHFIKNGVISSNGTVYVGDGSLGVRRTSPSGVQPSYLANRIEVGHYWNVRILQNQCNLTAFDRYGASLDNLVLPL
jgi:acid phosphatase type 7